MDALAAVCVALAAAGAVWVLHALSQQPQRRPWLSRRRTWLRVLAWTVVLTAAAVLGAVLGGSTAVAVGAVAVGACVAYAAVEFWADSDADRG